MQRVQRDLIGYILWVGRIREPLTAKIAIRPSEVDPVGGTTASGFVIGCGTVSDLSQKSSHEGLLLLRLGACRQGGRVVQAKRHVHSPRVENAARASAPHRHGCLPAQRLMRPAGVVQQGLRTPTGPLSAKFSIGGIRGLAWTFMSMRRSRSRMAV